MSGAAIDLVYGHGYQASGLAHFQRLADTHRLIAETGVARIHEPTPLDPALLHALHEPHYVDAVLQGTMPLAGSAYLPWSPALIESCLHMLGGQLLAADLALQRGLAINLACGFHHAHPGCGGGYCVFNGIALVAQQHPTWRVMVLDCDEHGGDGTEAFCARLPNLSAISIFGTRFGLRGGLRSRALAVPREHGTEASAADYLAVLDQALSWILDERPTLLLYQASADSHVDDPKATLRLSTDTLAERDWRVFRALRRAGIPVLVTMAGGYQAPAVVASLYAQTIHLAGRSAQPDARSR